MKHTGEAIRDAAEKAEGFCPAYNPVEIDGARHVWESPARYAQFRAPAFPRRVPCRSRCPALVSLARARTFDDIGPRVLCTPLPKSSAVPPDQSLVYLRQSLP